MAAICLDSTMTLANRTAVHDLGKEIFDIISHQAGACDVRYWRFFLKRPLNFTRTALLSDIGKAFARLVFRDISVENAPLWPRGGSEFMIFLEPLFSLRTSLSRKDIVICHDIAPITHPELYSVLTYASYDRVYKRVAQCAPAIVFVSEFTKREYLKRYPADYRLTEVIPLYFRETLAPRTSSYSRSKPYILMVGVFERRKNFVNALKAFRESGLSDSGFDLVLAGPRGNLSAEYLPILDQFGSVEHIGFVSDVKLSALYRGATALFFPSVVEGFGVPALEAAQLDVLPIVSLGTVLEEIAGPDSILTVPSSVEDMARALREAAFMPSDQRVARLTKIREYQQRFTLTNFRSNWEQLIANECKNRRRV